MSRRAEAVIAPRSHSNPMPMKTTPGTSFQLTLSATNAYTPQRIQATPTANKKPGELGRLPTWPGPSLRGLDRWERRGFFELGMIGA